MAPLPRIQYQVPSTSTQPVAMAPEAGLSQYHSPPTWRQP